MPTPVDFIGFGSCSRRRFCSAFSCRARSRIWARCCRFGRKIMRISLPPPSCVCRIVLRARASASSRRGIKRGSPDMAKDSEITIHVGSEHRALWRRTTKGRQRVDEASAVPARTSTLATRGALARWPQPSSSALTECRRGGVVRLSINTAVQTRDWSGDSAERSLRRGLSDMAHSPPVLFRPMTARTAARCDTGCPRRTPRLPD